LATNYSIVVTSVLHSFELQEFSRVLHIAVYEQGDIFCTQQNLSLFSELLRELAASTTQLVNLLQLAVRAKSPLAVGTYMSWCLDVSWFVTVYSDVAPLFSSVQLVKEV
jgi:hypothetical protein